MRKIEERMLQAIKNKENWSSDSTGVFYNPIEDCSSVHLHYNHIADYWHSAKGMDLEPLKVNSFTLALYPTTTTKSRLRALGANVTTKKGITYLNGVAV